MMFCVPHGAPSPIRSIFRGDGARCHALARVARWIGITAIVLLGFYPSSPLAETDTGNANIRMDLMEAVLVLADKREG